MPELLFLNLINKRRLSFIFISLLIAPTATPAQDSAIVQMLKRNAPNFAIDGNHDAENAQDVYLWSENENNINQQWIEISRGNGYYSYQKTGTNHCIDGNHGGERGQNVYLWECRSNNQNQHWLKVDVGNGNYRLEKRNAPGFSIDGRRGGAKRQSLYLWNSGDNNQNQHWTFNTVGNSVVETPAPAPTPIEPTPEPSPEEPEVIETGDADAVETDIEAANFLLQATFGPTEESIDELKSLGYSEWFRKQVATDIAPYIDDAILAEETTPSSRNRHRFAFNFWMDKATNGPDQLRQRAVFALSEIIATANNGSRLQRKSQLHATFKDHFQFNAFGNYRDLLQDVTYNPLMGRWLSYVGNRKADPETGSQPDENYARELMQLFTIGLIELNTDGTPRTINGEVIETYTQDDVVELAKVFTGLYWAGTGFDRTESLHTRLPQDILPMDMHDEFHSEGPKTFLGETLPDFGDGNRSISGALDIIFSHQNVAPFIGRQLIQRFTTGNPSSDYIERVATAFNDGRYTLPDGTQVGTGERGNLEPVFAAVIFDQEARANDRFSDQSWGKVREPIIRFVHWMRVANVTNIDIIGNRQYNQDWLFAQRPFNAESVFNFFRPGFIAPNTRTGDAGLTMPELQIASDSNLIDYFNQMRTFVQNNTDDDSYFVPSDDYARERSFDSAEELTDYLNMVYTANQMSDETWQVIHDAIDAIDLPNQSNDRAEAQLQRAMVGTLLTVTSVEFINQQ